MRLDFQANGWSGGWTNLFLDTESELQSHALAALRSAGLNVVSLVVQADQYDAAARVLYNKFAYRLSATIDTQGTPTAALAVFAQTLESITGFPATVSNLTAGDPAQPLPNSNPFPSLATGIGDALRRVEDDLAAALKKVSEGLALPIGAIAVVGVVVLIIFLKVEK